MNVNNIRPAIDPPMLPDLGAPAEPRAPGPVHELVLAYKEEMATLNVAVLLIKHDAQAAYDYVRYHGKVLQVIEALQLLHNDNYETMDEAYETAASVLTRLNLLYSRDLREHERDIQALRGKITNLDAAQKMLDDLQLVALAERDPES